MSETPTPRRLAWWKAALLSLGSGLLTALAFPPADASFLVWIGLLPLLTALWLGPERKWRGFVMGWLYGMGFYSAAFHWIIQVGLLWNIPAPLFLCIAFIPLMAFFSCVTGVWGMLAATLLRPRLQAAPDTSAAKTPERKKEIWNSWLMADMCSTLRCAVGLGALWVCMEWVRANGPLGCSWNSLGLALYDGLSLAQWAEFTGTLALSFLPVAVNVLLWCVGRRVWISFQGTRKISRPWDFYAAIFLIFMMFLGGLTLSRLYSPAAMFERDDVLKLPVLAVQNNVDQAERIANTLTPGGTVANKDAYRRGLTAAYIQSTADALDAIQKDTFKLAKEHPGEEVRLMQPAWVVWPESAVGNPFWKEESTGKYFADSHTRDFLEAQEELRDYAVSKGGCRFVLMTGGDEVVVDADGNVLGVQNSLIRFAEGMGIQSASKQHLMPFGEYIPLVQDFEWIGKIYQDLTNTPTGEGIRPGEGTEPLEVPVPGTEETVQVIPAVCYEDTDSVLLRKFARPGAQVIVNDTNDGWFRQSVCGVQQARSAAFRCIELRRPMVRAANSGVCCSIAPNGAFIHALLKEDGTPHLAGYSYAIIPVDRKAGLTLYAMLGDWAVLLCLLAAIGLAIPGMKRFRQD